VVLREMLHLLSELLGLNRGRIVLADGVDVTGGAAPGAPQRASAPGPSSIRYAYGKR
jgi:Nif-specific regulatory protein